VSARTLTALSCVAVAGGWSLTVWHGGVAHPDAYLPGGAVLRVEAGMVDGRAVLLVRARGECETARRFGRTVEG